jgi:Ser/Thr protein kinase RdoA (MazF antagonist)
MLKLPITHSVISSTALLPVIVENYEIGVGNVCRFLSNGLNDTYIIKSTTGTYILRVYKSRWRTESDIAFEVELLHHLKQKDIPVSVPIAKMDGDYWFEINAPEGKRFSVLFTFAEGSFSESEETAILYGREVAKMHLAMDDFKPLNERFIIDLDHLLDQPMLSISNSLAHRQNDIKYLKSLSELLRKRVEDISDSLSWGVCHGDLHGGNVYFCENGTVTHFDFDCGGYGWRAYDIAVFQWAKVRGKSKEQFENNFWNKYINSYCEHKEISEYEHQAIPLFVAIREIWLMGLHTGNSHIWGSNWQDDRYFDTNLQFLRDWCEVYSI